MAWDDSEGSGTILEAGRATLELLSRDQADLIDRIEVGRRIAGPSASRSRSKIPPGRRSSSPQAAPSSSPLRPRPVGDLNARVRAPDGMQLTLFTVLGD